MDEQASQPQEALSTPESLSTPSVDTPKVETARNRYLIAAVLILLAVGLGSWVWRNQAPKLFPIPTTPIADETSDWKTYRNKEFRFEFKYPADWISKELGDPNSGALLVLSAKNDFDNNILPIYSMDASKERGAIWTAYGGGASGTGLTNALANSIEFHMRNYKQTAEIKKEEDIVIGGANGKLVYIKPDQDNNIEQWAFVARDDNFVFMLGVVLDDVFYANVFKQILSTVRFSETDTSDWRNYRDEKYGFEFKYPNTYKLDATFNPNTESETRRIVTLEFGSQYYPREENLKFDGSTISFIVNKDIQSINNECRDVGSYDSIRKINNQTFYFIRRETTNDLETQRVIMGDYYLKTDSGCYALHFSFGWEMREMGTGRSYASLSKIEVEGLEKKSSDIISTFRFFEPKDKPSLNVPIAELLAQMFPGLSLNDEVQEVKEDGLIEGNFISSNEKSYLLISRASGSNPEGYGQVYLGVFDKDGKLQTPIVSNTKIPVGIEFNPPHIGDDGVSLQTYDCLGNTYIYIGTRQCSTGGITTCDDSGSRLVKIENGKFKVEQDLLSVRMMGLSDPTDHSIRRYTYLEKDQLPPNFDLKCTDKSKCLQIAYTPSGNLYAVFVDEVPFDNQVCRFVNK